MRFRNFLMSIAFGSTLLASTPSFSTIYIATYTGTVTNGDDITGEFSNPGTSLAGRSYVARYRYDTTLGNRDTSPDVSDDVYGGYFYAGSYNTPILDSWITINGKTLHISGLAQGDIYVDNSSYYHSSSETYNDGQTEYFNYLWNSAATYSAVPSVNSTPSLSGIQAYGVISISGYDNLTGENTHQLYLDLEGDNLHVVEAAVPEPASWALMMIGFGLIGASVRRGRTAAA